MTGKIHMIALPGKRSRAIVDDADGNLLIEMRICHLRGVLPIEVSAYQVDGRRVAASRLRLRGKATSPYCFSHAIPLKGIGPFAIEIACGDVQ